MNRPLKIAWVCPLEFTRFSDKLRFHGQPTPVISPWLTLLTQIFEQHTDQVELHVISAPPHLSADASITERGIQYHFIAFPIPLVRKKIPFIVKKLTRYAPARAKVKKLLRILKPDLVEFHGAEHDLAWAFFDTKEPKILNPQFFVNNYYRFRPTPYLRYWMKVESEIYSACRNFSYRNDHMKAEILKLNPTARLFRYQYPIKRPPYRADDFPVKDADLIFTARLIKSKGIEDLLRAVGLISKDLPGLRVKIIGQCNPEYMEFLRQLAASLGIEKNLEFLGFLETQEEMFQHLALAHISVLPTHFDLIPGSVLEAMFIGTPVVTYAAGGLPELNYENETVRLVETGNVAVMAKEILALLTNKAERAALARSALEKVNRDFDNELIYNAMMAAYQEIARPETKN